METYYVAYRDTTNDRADDETRAMCHVQILKSEDLDVTRKAVVAYMNQEADYLRRPGRSDSLTERADGIEAAAKEITELAFAVDVLPWEKISVDVDNLQFSIVKIVRD